MTEYIEREVAIDVREKLVELIGSTGYGNGSLVGHNFQKGFIEKIATHLIANGVTVQEWVSVKDRLPEPKENAICLNRHGDMMIGTYTEWGWMFPCYFEGPTHWMPLPHPLKGE